MNAQPTIHSASRSKQLTKQALTNLSKIPKAKNTKAFRQFVRLFYETVSLDDMQTIGQDNLIPAAYSAWNFAESHKTGSIKINVYNPDPIKDKWATPFTVIEILNNDRPFLVDSVLGEISALGHKVHVLIHPLYVAERTKAGKRTDLKGLNSKTVDGNVESFIQIHVEAILSADERKALKENLMLVLEDTRLAVIDWPFMRGKAAKILSDLHSNPPPVSKEEVNQTREFLEWMIHDKFTFLGYRRYDYKGSGKNLKIALKRNSALGIARHAKSKAMDNEKGGALSPEVKAFLNEPSLLMITKTTKTSTVHRRVLLDSVGIKIYDEKGNVTGEHRFFGLFTSVAYSLSALEIPIIHQKIKRALARSPFLPNSHDGKAIKHVLVNYPRDELFQISEDDLLNFGIGIVHLRDRQRVAVFVREDPFKRFVSCLVFIPRDRFNTMVRLRTQEILEESFNGKLATFEVQLGDVDSTQARAHFIIRTKNHIPDYNLAKIEHFITEASRQWDEDLVESLQQIYGSKKAETLIAKYFHTFPPGYQEHHSIALAIKDIERIEECIEKESIVMRLYRRDDDKAENFYVKIYAPNHPFYLSNILPTFENMGLKVLSETPYEIVLDSNQKVWVQDFHVQPMEKRVLKLSTLRESFTQLLYDVLHHEISDDAYNKLILTGQLDGRQINILRSYGHYLKQASLINDHDYVKSTLSQYGNIAVLLVKLFEARFLLKPDKKRGQTQLAIEKKIQTALADVKSLDQDRILQRFINVIRATLRTNVYQTNAKGLQKSYLSFKLASGKIDNLPRPVPYAEIYVYSPRMEAIHLRGGMVARGGLRWSDRLNDFRTEILGLMRSQMVKNSVIVPVGSKGGFICKNLPVTDKRDVVMQEVIACYQTMIRGLLDITDNLKNGKVVPPKQVIRHDGDDPYLVVAADKGTASFSDIANAISEEYDFWLGDAFASGGSKGYSHKDMGITARGAWESVKRHFREIDIDTQSQDFTVVGVGDMAGDVFGNGMLLSEHIRLVGAFNHMHIFVDPNPDAAKSFKERKRLFKNPKLNWSDYNKKLISKGGGIFSRAEKTIKLTPEIKAAFDIREDSVSPNALIRSILKADVDLLWFGGIGTYIKHPDETHAQVEDRSNDNLRINSIEVRAKVIGEGANLGVTQRGRIDYGLNGGRINTDFIDNSAGVDCSDHEVNIKILLSSLNQKQLSPAQRDQLLVSMTDDVARLVLQDNYLQTQVLSLESIDGPLKNENYLRLIRTLERKRMMNAKFEKLADEDELIRRQAFELSLTRPELSLLLSYTKIDIYNELLASSLPDDPKFLDDLLLYFPEILQKKYKKQIFEHRLRREIIATFITNSVVNRLSLTFVNDMREITGRSVSDIVRAYTIVRDVFNVRSLWVELESLDSSVKARKQYHAMRALADFSEKGTSWILQNITNIKDNISTINDIRPAAEYLQKQLPVLLKKPEFLEQMIAMNEYKEKGIPHSLAQTLGSLDILSAAFDIAKLANTSALKIDAAAKLYFDVSETFMLSDVIQSLEDFAPKSDWQQQAAYSLLAVIRSKKALLTQKVIHSKAKNVTVTNAFERWQEKNHEQVEHLIQMAARLTAGPMDDLSGAMVFAQALDQI